ncbi:MAG TPA: hypothetical protein VK157_02840 [Phycisphaerales bacterium]|nr:hypothetical protein [Phycisphaerales bacterium]
MVQTPLAVLLGAQTERLFREGTPCKLVLHEPEDSIAELLVEQGLVDLPTEITELVGRCSGFSIERGEQTMECMEFTRAWSGPASMLAPRCLELADYDGNAFIAEVNADAATSPVWYACHDPEVLVLQARSLAEFLDRVIDFFRPQRRYEHSAYGPDLNQRVWAVHEQPPCGQQVDEARASADEAVAKFAATLPPHAVVFDFRGLHVGEGVAYHDLDPDGQCWFASDPLLRAAEDAR